MIALYVLGIPLILGFFVVWRFVGLQFFSARRSDLAEVLPRIRELDIAEFDATASEAIEEYLLSGAAGLSVQERRQAYKKRLEVLRQGIFIILDNVVLFQQVGRFRISQLERDERKLSAEEEQLIYQLFDRAATCHLLCAYALMKLNVLRACQSVWPALVPLIGAIATLENQNLVTRYTRTVECVLELARRDHRDWVYDSLFFALTGSVAVEQTRFCRDRRRT